MPARKTAVPAPPVVSAKAVREFLLQSAELGSWTGAQLGKSLGLDTKAARDVLTTLAAAGYVEPDTDDPKRWRNTAAGNDMAGVKAVRPITRKTADRAVRDFLERAKDVNASNDYIYRVAEAILFGPYLTTAEKVKDVDIAVRLEPKTRSPEGLERLVREQVRQAEADGKRFKTWAEREHWGENKVLNHLKGRSRSIALHELGDWVRTQQHRVLLP